MSIAEQLQELKSLEDYIQNCPASVRPALTDLELQNSAAANVDIDALVQEWRVYTLQLRHLEHQEYTGKLSWEMVLNQVDKVQLKSAALLKKDELREKIQEKQLAILEALIAQERRIALKMSHVSAQNILYRANEACLAILYKEVLTQYHLNYLIERHDLLSNINITTGTREKSNAELHEHRAISHILTNINTMNEHSSHIETADNLSEFTKALNNEYFAECTARQARQKILAETAVKKFRHSPSVADFLKPLMDWLDKTLPDSIPVAVKTPVFGKKPDTTITELRKLVDDFAKDFEAICAAEREIYPDRSLAAEDTRRKALFTLQECLHRSNTYTKETGQVVNSLLQVMHDNEPTWRELSFIHIILNFLSFGWLVSSKKDASFFNHPAKVDEALAKPLGLEEDSAEGEGLH